MTSDTHHDAAEPEATWIKNDAARGNLPGSGDAGQQARSIRADGARVLDAKEALEEPEIKRTAKQGWALPL